MTAVSVIFPAPPDRADLVRRSVMALCAQTLPPELFEVVVAADGGDDGRLAKAIEGVPFRARVVDSPRPHGDKPHRNHARNAGCRAAVGRILWPVDCDFILSPCTLADLVAEHDAAVERNRLAVFTPPMRAIDMTPARWLERSRQLADGLDPATGRDFIASMGGLCGKRQVYSGLAKLHDPAGPASVPLASLLEGMPALPAEVLHALGGFSEDFTGWGGNKEELSNRLAALATAGAIELRCLGRACLYHQPHAPDPEARRSGGLRTQRLREQREREIRRGAGWWKDQERGALVAARRVTNAGPVVPKGGIGIVVMTYERPDLLGRLLDDLEREADAHPGLIGVDVYDDHSGADYRPVVERLRRRGWRYTRAAEHHGKQRHWQWVWRAYQAQQAEPAKLWILLPDDVRLCDRFVDRALAAWKGIRGRRKSALTLLVDASREASACWTGVKPTPDGPVDHIGWVDGLAVVDRSYFQALGWRVPEVPGNRWRDDPTVGTGVGRAVSLRLHERRRGMYRVRDSLVVHVVAPSRMNPEARAVEPMHARRFVDGAAAAAVLQVTEPVTASLASIPGRCESLRRVVASLLPQVQRLNVYLNGYENVPGFLGHDRIVVTRSQDHGDHGDAGKFFWCESVRGYHLTCDDDLIYPPDYVERLVAGIEARGRRAVVGLHGVTLVEPVASYYRSRKVLHCLHAAGADRGVHILGTGAMGYHHTAIAVKRADFEAPNMADVWFGLLGQQQQVPFVCLAHSAGWLQLVDGTAEGSIYELHRRDDRPQTDAVRRVSPWRMFADCAPPPPVRRGRPGRGANYVAGVPDQASEPDAAAAWIAQRAVRRLHRGSAPVQVAGRWAGEVATAITAAGLVARAVNVCSLAHDRGQTRAVLIDICSLLTEAEADRLLRQAVTALGRDAVLMVIERMPGGQAVVRPPIWYQRRLPGVSLAGRFNGPDGPMVCLAGRLARIPA